MANDSNRYGFFKNKSRAGLTDPFVAYPSWPTMPTVSFYSTFANNSNKTANVAFATDDTLGTNFRSNQAIVVHSFNGNVLITDWTSNAYVYDYTTSNVVSKTITINTPSLSSLPYQDYIAGPYDSNGNVHLLNNRNLSTNWDGIMFEYSPSQDKLQYHYVGPAGDGTNWGFTDFQGASGIAILANNTVLCANDKNYQGGVTPVRTDQKYQMYFPETKQQANTGLSYPNGQIASGNIPNDCSILVFPDITETNDANVFFVPSYGCYEGSYGNASLSANSSQRVIFEANVTTGDVTEHIPANLANTFNCTTCSNKQETVFSHGVYGADKNIYCFPGKSDNTNTVQLTQGIMKMDPTDVANAEFSRFSIWNHATEGTAHSSQNAFLGMDGFVHWTMSLTDGRYLCSLDTNPTSATYNTGYKNKISIINTYNVTSYTGSASSSSGSDEVVLNTTVDLSYATGVLTKVVGSGTTNPDLTDDTKTGNLNATAYYLQKISTNTYNLRDGPSSLSGSLLQSGLGSEDPAGLQFTITFDNPVGGNGLTAFTGNGNMIMPPINTTTLNPAFTDNPIGTFQVSGTGFWKLQYATWNRNNLSGLHNDN